MEILGLALALAWTLVWPAIQVGFWVAVSLITALALGSLLFGNESEELVVALSPTKRPS